MGLAVLVLVPVLLFLPVYRFSFVTLDDTLHVYRNPAFESLTAPRLWELLLRPFQGLYIPVTYFVWGIESALTRWLLSPVVRPIDARLFHVVNLVLHVINTLLVYQILCRLVRSHWGPFFGAILFACHPLQVEAVAWVSGLKDVLCGMFSLLSLYLALTLESRWTDSEKARHRFLIASLCFVLALLSKPSAVAVPFLIFVIYWFQGQRTRKETACIVLPWAFLSVPFLVLTKLSQPDFVIDEVVSLGARFWVALDAVAFYISKVIFPFFLTLNYGRTPQAVLDRPWIYLLWLTPILILMLIRRSEFRRYWIAGLGLFVGYLIPVLGIVPFYYQKFSTVADRFAYLSLLGVSLVVAVYGASLRRWFSRTLFVCALILLALRAHDQLMYWRSNLTLLTRVAAINPHAEVFYTLGVLLADDNRLDEAVGSYQKALALNPKHAATYNNLGLAYFHQGRLPEAEHALREAERLAPHLSETANNLGVLFLRRGEKEKARTQFRRAIELNPRSSDSFFNLGTTYESEGKWDLAISLYLRSLRLRPQYVRFRIVLARALVKAGRYSEAEQQYLGLLQENRAGAEAYLELGDLYARQGRLPEARRSYERATRVDPRSKIAARARERLTGGG